MQDTKWSVQDRMRTDETRTGLGTCILDAGSLVHQLNPGELSCFTIHTEGHVVCLEIAVSATLGMWPRQCLQQQQQAWGSNQAA